MEGEESRVLQSLRFVVEDVNLFVLRIALLHVVHWWEQVEISEEFEDEKTGNVQQFNVCGLRVQKHAKCNGAEICSPNLQVFEIEEIRLEKRGSIRL